MQSWFGGNETGNAIADVVLGMVNPAGRMPMSFPHEIEHCTGSLNWQADNGKVLYGEGLFVGYKGESEQNCTLRLCNAYTLVVNSQVTRLRSEIPCLPLERVWDTRHLVSVFVNTPPLIL
jgi:hypothetical protein